MTFFWKINIILNERSCRKAWELGTHILVNLVWWKDLDASEHSIIFDTFSCVKKLKLPTFININLGVVEISTGNILSASNMTIWTHFLGCWSGNLWNWSWNRFQSWYKVFEGILCLKLTHRMCPQFLHILEISAIFPHTEFPDQATI